MLPRTTVDLLLYHDFLKHYPGQHDQADHGNWANGGGVGNDRLVGEGSRFGDNFSSDSNIKRRLLDGPGIFVTTVGEPGIRGPFKDHETAATVARVVGGDKAYVLSVDRKEFDRIHAHARVSVRHSNYRDKDGYLISGYDTIGRDVKVWVPTREEADRARVNIIDGKDPLTGEIEGTIPAEGGLRRGGLAD